MEVPQSSEVKEKVRPVQQSCLFLVISILKEYFPFSLWKVGMVALDHLVIKLDPTPKAPKVQQKNAMGKRHPNLGKRCEAF